MNTHEAHEHPDFPPAVDAKDAHNMVAALVDYYSKLLASLGKERALMLASFRRAGEELTVARGELGMVKAGALELQAKLGAAEKELVSLRASKQEAQETISVLRSARFTSERRAIFAREIIAKIRGMYEGRTPEQFVHPPRILQDGEGGVVETQGALHAQPRRMTLEEIERAFREWEEE